MSRRLPVTDRRLIRQNHRFATYEAKFDGRRVFVKHALQPALSRSITAEVYGLKIFGELQQAQQLAFCVPEILFSGPDYLITSWARGKMMDFAPKPARADSAIGLMAEVYASIDTATTLQMKVPTKFALSDSKGINEADRLSKRLHKVKWKHLIPEKEVDHALSRISKRCSGLPARLTHADLVPSNVLQTKSGQISVVDYESTSLLWPRFYDVINYAHNLIVETLSHVDSAALLLNKFFGLINEPIEKWIPSLNTIANVRSLSAICEYGTASDEMHNTQGDLTEERAELLGLFLKRSRRGLLFIET